MQGYLSTQALFQILQLDMCKVGFLSKSVDLK